SGTRSSYHRSGHQELRSRRMCRPESPAQFPQLLVIETSSKTNVPCEIEQVLFLASPNEFLERKVHNLLLGRHARQRHRFFGQFIIEVDIGPHVVYLDVYRTPTPPPRSSARGPCARAPRRVRRGAGSLRP